MNDHLIETGRP